MLTPALLLALACAGPDDRPVDDTVVTPGTDSPAPTDTPTSDTGAPPAVLVERLAPTWTRVFDGSWIESLGSLAVASDGTTIVAGSAASAPTHLGRGSPDEVVVDDLWGYWLTRHDVDGTILWSHTIAVDNRMRPEVVVGADDRVYVAGSGLDIALNTDTASPVVLPVHGDHDVFLAAYDLAGQLLWVRSSGGPGADKSTSLALGPNGELYLATWTTGEPFVAAADGPDAIVVPDADPLVTTAAVSRWSPDGDLEWVVPIEATRSIDDLIVTPGGTVAIIGRAVDGTRLDPAQPAFGNSDSFVAGLSRADGAFAWSWRMTRPVGYYSVLADLAPVGFGLAVLGHYTGGGGLELTDGVTTETLLTPDEKGGFEIELADDGSLVHHHRLTEAVFSVAFRMAEAPDGTRIYAGTCADEVTWLPDSPGAFTMTCGHLGTISSPGVWFTVLPDGTVGDRWTLPGGAPGDLVLDGSGGLAGVANFDAHAVLAPERESASALVGEYVAFTAFRMEPTTEDTHPTTVTTSAVCASPMPWPAAQETRPSSFRACEGPKRPCEIGETCVGGICRRNCATETCHPTEGCELMRDGGYYSGVEYLVCDCGITGCEFDAPPVAEGGIDVWSGPLPLPVAEAHALATAGGWLYVTDGATLHRAELDPDGLPGAWADLGPLPTALERPALAATADRVFLVGGAVAGVATADVWSAEVDGDGLVGAWQPEPPMPVARSRHVAEVADDHLVVSGGWTFQPAVNPILAVAPLEATGLGDWTVAGLWGGVLDGAVTVAFGRIFALDAGGATWSAPVEELPKPVSWREEPDSPFGGYPAYTGRQPVFDAYGAGGLAAFCDGLIWVNVQGHVLLAPWDGAVLTDWRVGTHPEAGVAPYWETPEPVPVVTTSDQRVIVAMPGGLYTTVRTP